MFVVQQQQQRAGSSSTSSPFRASASPTAAHRHASGTADSRHGSGTEVRRSASPHRSSATAAAGSSSGTPSRLSGQHRERASPARQTNDRSHSQLMSKSSQNTQELLNKGNNHLCLNSRSHHLHMQHFQLSPVCLFCL